MPDADIPGAGGIAEGRGGGAIMWTLVPEMPQLASYSPYFAVLCTKDGPITRKQ